MATSESPVSEVDQVVRVSRVIERPPAQRNFPGTITNVAAWLRGPARRIPEALELLDELCWRIVGAGIPLARMTFHLPTLHPQYYSTGCRWSRNTGQTEE